MKECPLYSLSIFPQNKVVLYFLEDDENKFIDNLS